MTKHIGRHKGTGQRLSVVFMQLPDEKDQALVVYSDQLPDKYHDDFMTAIESPECQNAKVLYEGLQRNVFWHGNPMLDTLHKEGFLKKVPTSSVVMMPNPQQQVPLDDILAQMAKIEAENPTPAKGNTETNAGERVQEQVDQSLGEDNKAIAQNLLMQAVLLEKEAEKKREEAVKYDPSLAEKAMQPAKRGRGRPKGTTKEAMAAKSEPAVLEQAVASLDTTSEEVNPNDHGV
jgi:hypothetical protein